MKKTSVSPSGKVAKKKHANSAQSNITVTTNSTDETMEQFANQKVVLPNDVEIKIDSSITHGNSEVCKLKGKKKNRPKKRKRFEVGANNEKSEEHKDGSYSIENKVDENACSTYNNLEPQMDVENNNINARVEENNTYQNSFDDHSETKQAKKYPKRPKIKKKMLYNLPRPTKESADALSTNNNKAERAINYLQTWNNDRNIWKFEKLTQLWLIKNMFNENLVSNDDFKILLEYMKDMKGQIRNTASELCLNIIKKMEKLESRQENENLVYSRAQSALLYVQ